MVVILWGFICLPFSLAHLNVKKKETAEHEDVQHSCVSMLLAKYGQRIHSPSQQSTGKISMKLTITCILHILYCSWLVT